MDKLFRSWMFCPANNPKLLYTAPNFASDAIIFDLEDAVPVDEKEDARELLAEALKVIDYKNSTVLARINPLYTPFGEEDVRMLVTAGLRYIRFPMCETVGHVDQLDKILSEVETKIGIPVGTVKVAAALETPLGVYNALTIAQHSRIFAISLGAEDFTRTMGATRTSKGVELDYARGKIVLEARVAGVLAIDTVWTRLDDLSGFEAEATHIRDMGFDGKGCIHPSQVTELHRIFSPDPIEIEKSLRIIQATKEHGIEQGGVIKLDGKMVDIPVIEKAKRVVRLAIAAGMIKEH